MPTSCAPVDSYLVLLSTLLRNYAVLSDGRLLDRLDSDGRLTLGLRVGALHQHGG